MGSLRVLRGFLLVSSLDFSNDIPFPLAERNVHPNTNSKPCTRLGTRGVGWDLYGDLINFVGCFVVFSSIARQSVLKAL